MFTNNLDLLDFLASNRFRFSFLDLKTTPCQHSVTAFTECHRILQQTWSSRNGYRGQLWAYFIKMPQFLVSIQLGHDRIKLLRRHLTIAKFSAFGHAGVVLFIAAIFCCHAFTSDGASATHLSTIEPMGYGKNNFWTTRLVDCLQLCYPQRIVLHSGVQSCNRDVRVEFSCFVGDFGCLQHTCILGTIVFSLTRGRTVLPEIFGEEIRKTWAACLRL